MASTPNTFEDLVVQYFSPHCVWAALTIQTNNFIFSIQNSYLSFHKLPPIFLLCTSYFIARYHNNVISAIRFSWSRLQGISRWRLVLKEVPKCVADPQFGLRTDDQLPVNIHHDSSWGCLKPFSSGFARKVFRNPLLFTTHLCFGGELLLCAMFSRNGL